MWTLLGAVGGSLCCVPEKKRGTKMGRKEE